MAERKYVVMLTRGDWRVVMGLVYAELGRVQGVLDRTPAQDRLPHIGIEIALAALTKKQLKDAK